MQLLGAARCGLVPYSKTPQQALAAQMPHVSDHLGLDPSRRYLGQANGRLIEGPSLDEPPKLEPTPRLMPAA
jgi:hypothetical protein